VACEQPVRAATDSTAAPTAAQPPFQPPQLRDPSLLRFLVDMRGEDTDNKQVREGWAAAV
jgi:hypothetical protein